MDGVIVVELEFNFIGCKSCFFHIAGDTSRRTEGREDPRCHCRPAANIAIAIAIAIAIVHTYTTILIHNGLISNSNEENNDDDGRSVLHALTWSTKYFIMYPDAFSSSCI